MCSGILGGHGESRMVEVCICAGIAMLAALITRSDPSTYMLSSMVFLFTAWRIIAYTPE